jgi:hypothetical protein
MGVFDKYVSSYSDIAQNYNSWLNDRSNIHWSQYVDAASDLSQAWQAENRRTGISKWDWGWNHYQNYGKKEGRLTPKVINTNGLSDAPGSGGRGGYTTLPVYQDGSGNPTTNETAQEGFGYDHWEKRGGKNEYRILPGGEPFKVQPNGSISVNTQVIGRDAQQAFNNFANKYNSSNGTNFKDIANSLNALGETESKILTESGSTNSLVNAFYGKVSPWDPGKNSAYQPPMGAFDPTYYVTTDQGREAYDQWQKAVKGTIDIGGQAYPDVSLVGKYNQDSFLQYNYAVVHGKTERGNRVVKAEAAEDFKEIPMTDAQYQLYRDQVLGLGSFTTLKEWEAAQDPEFLKEWVSSLSPEDAEDRKNGYLIIPSISQLPEKIRSQAKMSRGDTLLEGRLTSVLGAKEQEAADRFRSLTVDTFKETLNEYKKQRAKEQQFEFYSGLPGFDEIMNVNSELSNSLLGDTGVGGLLSLTGENQEKTEDSLEKQFSAITGIPSKSSAVYNWQKWFDETLTKRYQEGATFTDFQDPDKQYTIDKEFAEDYIKRYLNPRFNTSRSMSEFMSYMDVTQGEENIFQTQSALNSLKTLADLRAQKYLDDIKNSGTSGFDSEFYFNPSGGDVDISKHNLQKTKVTEDWDNARRNGEQVVPGTNPPQTWNQLAYFHGYNLNDKAQFAKLHYQVYGRQQGFDPARDKLSFNAAQSFIDNDILPTIANEKLKLSGVSFLNFVTPREYADKMLEGIDPIENKPEWEKVLQSMGLSGKEMGLEELKTYIEEAFQTGEATKIRESIKYLNEKKEKVTQKKLGVDYIERPEDTAPRDNPTETQLYSVFKSAGFAGTEDDFYKEFMPDTNREDMELLTQAGKGFKEGGIFNQLTSKDPFEALGSIDTLLGEDEDQKTSKQKDSTKKEKSYFRFADEDDDEDTTTVKSDAGQSFLGSFTSAFKGLTPKY